MKRDFFRKNIFTIGGVVVFILILFIIVNPFNSKQSSTKGSLNKLKKENKQLMQENENLNMKLDTEKLFYMDKRNQLNKQVSASATASDEFIAESQKLFEYLQTEIKNELVDSLSIFSPEHTKKGDNIAGLIVSDIRKEIANGSTSYLIDFTGEFKVRGSIVSNDGDGYSFIVEKNLEKLPHSLQEFKGVHFVIINENELVKAFGDKLEKMPDSDKLEVEAVFKNYSYNYVPETDWLNGAEFVRLISQN